MIFTNRAIVFHCILPLVVMFFWAPSCAEEEEFPELGNAIASPIDITASKDKKYFFVLNSDMDRTYNAGSILVLDQAGEKVGKAETPRLGRHLTLIGDRLVAGFSGVLDDEENPHRVQIYDVSTPTSPKLESDFTVDCEPLNAAGGADYRYFAVSCKNGGLLIGDFEKKTLKLVRDYRFSRRAIYLDPKRELVFGFVTDIGGVAASDGDAILTDKAAWDDSYTKTETANEIPDDYEASIRARRRTTIPKRRFQFYVYDIASEAAAKDEDPDGFPFRDEEDEVVEKEMRWLYFTLTNFDGTPDVGFGHTDLSAKYYRTNFWSAKPAPGDPNAFYLSHRGLGVDGRSPHANNIVRVDIVGDPKLSESGEVPATSSYFAFSRVFGYTGAQTDGSSYLGDFEITQSAGEDIAIVNSFRDLSNFRAHGGGSFSVTAATMDESLWLEDLTSKDGNDSYYQLALGQNGRVATCSFYGNAVIFLDVNLGTAITENKRFH